MIKKETQSKLTPEEALNILKEGNKRFLNHKKNTHDLEDEIEYTKDGQYPLAAILSCIDSRTSSELIFDLGMGDAFSVRLAGNVVNEDVLGSIEYSCKVAGAKIVLILGHTKCGAVTAACQNIELGNITALLSKIKPAVQTVSSSVEDVTTPENVQKVADENVRVGMNLLREKSPILAEMEKKGEIKIIGGMYDISTGEVAFFKS